MNGILTVNQVAERLHLNPETIRRWVRSGALRGYKLGARKWRIKEHELEEFINSQANTGLKHTESNK